MYTRIKYLGLASSLIEINNLEIKKNEIVDIVSDVEHNYIGLKGGIMDQFTILNGQKNKLIHLECHSRNFKYVTAEFKDYQFTADDLQQFTGFTIKIVMMSTNECSPVRIKDFRVICSHQESLHSHDAVSVILAPNSKLSSDVSHELWSSLIHKS